MLADFSLFCLRRQCYSGFFLLLEVHYRRPTCGAGFITPSQTFDIVIIFERSQKKHAYFWLYNAIWVHLNVSIGVANPDRPCHHRNVVGLA